MSKTAKILLLDADEASALFVTSACQTLSCDIEHCLHPHEALFTVGGSPPDIVLVAHPLAKTTTAGFVSNLQSVDGCTGIYPVAILPPGMEHDAVQEELMDGDFRDCLRKPITRDDLSMMLTRWRHAGRRVAQTETTMPNPQQSEDMSAREKLHQEVSHKSIKSVLQQDLSTSHSGPDGSPGERQSTKPDSAAQSAAFAAIEAATSLESTGRPPEEKSKPQGPSLTAEIGGEQRKMTIEMAMGQSMMVLLQGERVEVGSEFAGSLSYRDPAPGRNRVIPLKLKLRVGSCTPAENEGYRCSLRVEDVRPTERWGQFVRVCRAALEE